MLTSGAHPNQDRERRRVLKKEEISPAQLWGKDNEERWWFIASQLGGAFHSGTPEQRDVSHKLPAPRHLESFQSHKSQSLEGLRTKSPLASRLGKSRCPQLLRSHPRDTRLPQNPTSFPQIPFSTNATAIKHSERPIFQKDKRLVILHVSAANRIVLDVVGRFGKMLSITFVLKV